VLRPLHTSNKVAENGDILLKRQLSLRIAALLPETTTMLPFRATVSVAVFGNFVSGMDRSLGSIDNT